MSAPLPFDPIAEAARHWREHGWVDAADGMATVTAIMRAQQIVLARVDAVLRPVGLTFARYEVLMLLLFARTQALPMRVLGQRLQVHPTSITNAVDRLEGAGLVRREPHPGDGRALLVALQPAGAELARSATAAVNEAVFARLGVDDSEQRDVRRGLESLRRAAGDFG